MRKETNARGANPRDFKMQRIVPKETLKDGKTPNPQFGKLRMVKHSKTS